MTKRRRFIITERQAKEMWKLSKPKRFIVTEDIMREWQKETEMTEYKFNSNIKRFLHDLLVSPNDATVPELLAYYGVTKEKLLKRLLNQGIIKKEEKIRDTDENGNPKTAMMGVKYTVPKKDFERKLNRLYIKLFESNLPQQLDEDGEGGCGAMGGTTCGASSGEFSTPLFGIQRQKGPTELEETTTCGSVGAIEYDAPAFGDEETLKRHNGVGGSVSINQA